MKYNWVPASTAGMRPLEPVWLDLNQCGTSHVSRPKARASELHWTVNRPGRVIGTGGHIHDGGIDIRDPQRLDRPAHLQLGGPLRR